MSVQAMTRVMENSSLRGVPRLVLLCIANHETEERGAFPSIERLSKESHASVRSVQSAIRTAEKAGELEVQLRAGPHGTNLYRVGCATAPPQNLHPAENGRESAPDSKELAPSSSGSSASQVGNLPRSPGFTAFWMAYPRKRSKADARKAFRAATKKHGVRSILEGLDRALPEFTRRPIDKVPYPATWLRAEGYLDEPEEDEITRLARQVGP